MSKPSDTLWDYEEHTQAKHELLVKYLHAWYPIMAHSGERSVNVIDGFAGPGRYTGGQPGSPLLMIDAFVNHTGRDAPAMTAMNVNFDFIEQRHDRAECLQGELDKLQLPANVHVAPVHEGSFDSVMTPLLNTIAGTHRLAPTFVFIDPFGYTGHGLELSSRILHFKKCEALIYVPLPFIARFVHDPKQEPALNNLFGDECWKDARAAKGKAAERILHDRFLDQFQKAAGHAVSFAIEASAGRGWSGYTLYFGSGHWMGIAKMKDAMWKVDPTGGSRFVYSVNPDQLTLFDSTPDLQVLELLLHRRFGQAEFTVRQAEVFSTLNTPFAISHLRKGTLTVAEKGGRLVARQPGNPRRRCGAYPEGTILRFTEKPASP